MAFRFEGYGWRGGGRHTGGWDGESKKGERRGS